MKEPIFILGAHKSGTSLLRSLLDNHPRLSVLPIESHPFQHLRYGIDYPFRFQWPGPSSREVWLTNTREWLRAYNERNDYLGDAAVAGKLDLEAFDKTLKMADVEHAGLPGWIEAYFSAIQESAGSEPAGKSGRRFVEKSVEHSELALDLAAMFPDARFLHIVRNPYANLVAIRKYKGRKRFPRLRPVLKALKGSFCWLERNQRLITGYQVLRYEDLVYEPRATMDRVAGFLGLEWRDSLLEPTSLGAPWSGNSTSERAFQGVSSGSLAKWLESIHPLEVELINRHLAWALDRFGYSREASRGSPWRPGPAESPGTYLRNRLLWKESPAEA